MVNVNICENVERIRGLIAESAKKSGRKKEEIQLIAVTKNHKVEEMVKAIQEAGVTNIGENRVQEAQTKWASWPENVNAEWHLIGHLQRNKARKALEIFNVIQSLDSIALAERLERICVEMKRTVRVLLEVNTSGESAKHGVAPDDVYSLFDYVMGECPSLTVQGLMTVGPLTEEESEVREAFALLRSLKENLSSSRDVLLPELSMGMSGDFQWAIEEGSTMVRIGTAIFGPRSY